MSQNIPLQLEVPHQYRDYIAWLQRQDVVVAEAYWRRYLAGITEPTPLSRMLPTVGEGKEQQPYEVQRLYLSTEETADLVQQGRQQQVTLNTLIEAAWAVVLSRYTGMNDVIFGTTVAGRPTELAGVENMIGLFINTLPVRVQVEEMQPLGTWLRSLQRQQVEMRQYDYVGLVQIQGWSEIPRGQPLFETLLVFENYPVDAVVLETAQELKIRDVSTTEETNYPLTLQVIVQEDQLELRIGYKATFFSAGMIQQILRHLRQALSTMAESTEIAVSDIPLLTQQESDQILITWNDTRTSYPREASIHQLFEIQVEETPDTIAVVYGKEQLTYRELNCRANQLAHYLQQQGIGPDSPVGICMERSVAMILSILGILKAGGTYVPLDPTIPDERLSFLLNDVQTSLARPG